MSVYPSRIADHWHTHHAPHIPAQAQDAEEEPSHTPIENTQNTEIDAPGEDDIPYQNDAFIAAFGNIYEHSPWVAERAFSNGPVDVSNVEDVIHAMSYAFISASDEELKRSECPSGLAGKLAAAKTLTPGQQKTTSAGTTTHRG